MAHHPKSAFNDNYCYGEYMDTAGSTICETVTSLSCFLLGAFPFWFSILCVIKYLPVCFALIDYEAS